MRAKKDLANIVGKDFVFDDEATLAKYATDRSFAPSVRPRFVVQPANGSEVQKIVKWAHETNNPLVPVSSRAPHYHGDTVPRVGGAVILDMSRMNKILTIHAPDLVCIVEPGVTFDELIPALEKEGLAPYMPLCPRANQSAAIAATERNPTTIPRDAFDIIDPFNCCQVVYGTGDLYNTGEAAGPDDTLEKMQEWGNYAVNAWGLSQWEEGRLVSGAQGTMGIMNWVSMRCRFKEKFGTCYMVPSDTLDPLFELAYRLLRCRQGDQMFIVNNLNLAALVGKDANEIEEIRNQLPPYILVVGFMGITDLPEERFEWQVADFKDFARECGQSLAPVETLGPVIGKELFKIINATSGDVYWKERFKGGFHDLFFQTMLNKTPGFEETVLKVANSKHFDTGNIGLYIQPQVQGTSVHCEFDFYYDPEDAAETAKVRDLAEAVAPAVLADGAFFSRPYGNWAKIAYGRMLDTAVLERKMKDIFDPENILNPGRLCFE